MKALKQLVFAFIVGIAAMLSTAANAVTIPIHTQTTWFDFDAKETPSGFDAIDMHLTWLKEPDSDWGYYAQFWFWFEGGMGGYTGLQKDAYSIEKKKAIFSIWDKNGSIHAHPASPNCKYFGHEGLGAQCIPKFDWKADREYKFRVVRNAEPTASGRGQRWSAWIVDMVTGELFLIGQIDVDDVPGYKGYGNIANYGHAAVTEFYVGDAHVPCTEVPYFGLEWRGPYGNSGTVAPSKATQSYITGVGENCPNVNSVGTGPFTTKQEIGPGIVKTNKHNDSLWAKYNRNYYRELDCFFEWAERAFPDSFNNDKRFVPRISKSFDGHMYYRDYRDLDAKGNLVGQMLGVDVNTDIVHYTEPDGSFHQAGFASQYVRDSGCRIK